MTSPFRIHALGAALTLAGSFTAFAGEASPDAIASIGSRGISAQEIREDLARLDPRERASLAADPALLNKTVRAILARKVVRNEADAAKWEERPEIAARLRATRDAVILESYLENIATPPAEFPEETEIKTVYEANKAALTKPRCFRIERIFIAAPKTTDARSLADAEATAIRVRKELAVPGAEFAAIAARENKTPGLATPEWVDADRLRPEIAGALAALKPGAVTEPLRLEDGWHLIRLMETRESGPAPYAEVREALRTRIRTERTRVNREAYLKRLLEENPVSLNEIALRQVLPPEPAKP